MVTSDATKLMNRAQNLTALAAIVETMAQASPGSTSMENLRRAAYLHQIIAAILSEQVNCLPETSEVIH